MMRTHGIRRLSTLDTWSRPSIRTHLSASVRHRLNLPLEHLRRRNHYQAFPTRLRFDAQNRINEYLALSENDSVIGQFVASVTFIRELTGYTFTDRHLLLQALYGCGDSSQPHLRLALLGDILLEYILIDDWFRCGLPTSEYNHTLNTCTCRC